MNPKAKKIIEDTAAEFGLTVEELQCRSRLTEYVVPRQLAMMRCLEAGFKHPEVGRMFNRDRGTVYHAEDTIKTIRQFNPGRLEPSK